MDLVIVESPAKAKTINKYLGSNYKVLASFGHVRDLPPKDGSVRPDEDFAMSWSVDSPSSKRLSDIAKAVKDADTLILATDPDREGEAISWHVLEVLKQKKVLKDKPVQRVVFNAITKKAVLDALAHPREVDAPLVDAYLARRALDYLVGFTLSPVLWRKLPGARSAGRVQSVALRLVCDRCLVEYAFAVDVAFHLILEVPGEGSWQVREMECSATDLDTVQLARPVADLNEILRQQLFLSLPGKYLCCSDCRGLCSNCGADLNTTGCTCEQEAVNSPFAVLASLKGK